MDPRSLTWPRVPSQRISTCLREVPVSSTVTICVEVVVPVADFDDPNLDVEAEYLGKHSLRITSWTACSSSAAEDDSPYPEVRAAVANTDDTTIPVNTFRAWFIGICWAILIPGLNQFFFFRFPSVTIGGIVAQLLSFPVGRAWAAYMPNKTIFGVHINPGPFTVKEHVLITVSSSSQISSLTSLLIAICFF